jgi:hypothetical protein
MAVGPEVVPPEDDGYIDYWGHLFINTDVESSRWKLILLLAGWPPQPMAMTM